ncbi:BseRI endonuclease [Flavobacterium suaedae]|uniref:site-specific DNA-methyltransferase (adenine-specific) n=1 Tax=Flavobacterium suaedae TaxID=1767027 RepID=A0ABQ1JB70_9FLAO|nr:N-6 DNA methylase [Flavobacterium suaedae]GGB64429.1 BseRI endonuclease [Flavobacterium suaedae]
MNELLVNIEAAQRILIDNIILIEQGKNEQIIRDSFTSHLRQVFPEVPNWVVRHIQGSEAAVKIVKESKGRTGFVDNLVDLTAIEYESNLKVSSKYNTGLNQVKDYVSSLVNQGHDPALIIGILSDTIRWYAFQIDVEKLTEETCSRDNIILTQIEFLDCSTASEKDASDLARFLQKYLGRIGARPVSASSIANDLGFKSKFCEPHLISLLGIVNEAFSVNQKYASLITELWCNFVSYLREDGKADDFDLKTYVDEYYILTLGKLICANYLEQRALSSDDNEIASIINGKFFENKGLLNFVEYDYFGWLNSTEHVNAILPIAKAIQQDLVAYNFNPIPSEDLFGELMAQLANRSQRLLLGQEWTPGWLSHKLVAQVIESISPDQPLRLIDMCCGSGSMIVEAIEIAKERISRNNPDISIEQRIHLLTESITGFDIDPLAVMLSKINWVLKAKDWIQPLGTHQISIPIYHADSLFAITPISNNAEENENGYYSLKIAEYSINLPSFLVTPEYHFYFDTLIDTGYRLIVSNKQQSALTIDPDTLQKHIESIQESSTVKLKDVELDQVLTFFLEFITTVDELNRDGRNGIWAYILRNSFRPGLVAGQFNGLVSNPPWLALSKVANNPYQVILKKMAEDFGIKPFGSSHLHIELATIFLLYAVNQYLLPNAQIGCIVPETILNGHHHNRFRTAEFRTSSKAVQFSVEEIWKIQEQVFKNNAAVLFGRKAIAEVSHETIPGKAIRENYPPTDILFYKNKQGNRTAWSEQNMTGANNGFFNPANFRQGADIMPRNLFFYEVGESSNPQLFHMQSIDPTTSPIGFTVKDAKKFSDFHLTGRMLPKKLFFDVITSNLLTPFNVAEFQKAFLPLKKSDSNTWQGISDAEVALFGAVTQSSFESISQTIDPKSVSVNTIYNLINTLGKLRQQLITPSGYIVMTGAGGGKVCSAYLDVNNVDITKLIIDQTIYWAQVASEDEAIYLTGLLNSDAINIIIEDFQPKGAFGKRHVHKLPFGVTPPYDESSSAHLEVVTRTKALISEYNELKGEHPSMLNALNPNNGSLNKRRRILIGFVTGLSSYEAYEEACRSVYGL